MADVAWAILLPRASALAAGVLRLRADVRVREADENAIWIRGENLTEELDLELRKLPGARRHTVDAEDLYTEVDHRIPAGTLPAGGWLPLSAWLALAPQPAALAGGLPRRAALRVVRADAEHPASLLLTTIEAWAVYATTAPAVRLRPLRFAVCADGRTIVQGTPLPPVRGRRYYDRSGVALPCGFTFSPAVEPAALRERLGLSDGDLALFGEDGTYQHLAADGFTRATRAAARLSSPKSVRASLEGAQP
jgi:hypothetical protein